MSGPFKMKYNNSSFPFKSPMKKADGLEMPPPSRGFNRPEVPSGNISTYHSDKEGENLETGKRKVDLMHHITGVRKNPSGKKTEKSRTDYLKSLDK
jgi:hypothetical protein